MLSTQWDGTTVTDMSRLVCAHDGRSLETRHFGTFQGLPHTVPHGIDTMTPTLTHHGVTFAWRGDRMDADGECEREYHTPTSQPAHCYHLTLTAKTALTDAGRVWRVRLTAIPVGRVTERHPLTVTPKPLPYRDTNLAMLLLEVLDTWLDTGSKPLCARHAARCTACGRLVEPTELDADGLCMDCQPWLWKTRGTNWEANHDVQ